jgi:hypothetical protein
MTDKLSRRDVLRRGAVLGALAALGAAACGKEKSPALTCTDISGLSAGDLQVRTTLAYVDQSTEPGKSCANCQQFVAPATAGTCGTCKVLKGPINPAGNCKSFVAKPS